MPWPPIDQHTHIGSHKENFKDDHVAKGRLTDDAYGEVAALPTSTHNGEQRLAFLYEKEDPPNKAW